MALTKLNILILCIFILQFVLLIVSNPIEVEETKLIRNKRWGRVARRTHWPDATVYYKIGCKKYTEDEINLIKTALNGIMNRTCVQFIEIDDTSLQRNYINLSCDPLGSCVSKLGFEGGVQHMNLARKKFPNEPLRACLSNRKIQHEFLHALGFKHEHTSFNRDDYIEIKYDNIEEGWEKYFAKDPDNKYQSYGCEFDYNSVMMPPTKKHTKNGQPTFVPRDSAYTPLTMGIAPGISECDVTRINNMYCVKKNKNKNKNKKVRFEGDSVSAETE